MIFRRTTNISLILNGVLILVTMGFFSYTLMLKSTLDVCREETKIQKEMAEAQRKIAVEQLEKAELQMELAQARADSAAMEALRQRRKAENAE